MSTSSYSKTSLLSELFLIIMAAIVLGAGSVKSADLVDYSLSDVRVLYLFDDPAQIDWPTIYYLNDSYGCRVDLVSLKQRVRPLTERYDLPERQLFLSRYHLPANDTSAMNELVSDLFKERYPDLIVIGQIAKGGLYSQLREYLLTLKPSPSRLFNIRKIYQLSDRGGDSNASTGLVLNGREFMRRYRDRIDLEVPFFFDWYNSKEFMPDKLTRYELLSSENESASRAFMEGISNIRLVEIVNKLPISGPMKTSYIRQSTRFVNYFSAARNSTGQPKVDFTVNGYKELLFFKNQPASVVDSFQMDDFRPYISDLLAMAEAAALNAVGVEWEGSVKLHDSPHGPRLKFVASLSANGPKQVSLTQLAFHPYWDTAAVILDNQQRIVDPHQSFVREFLIDLDKERLESSSPDSLLFSAEIIYGQIHMRVYSSLPVWPSPELKVKFDPPFAFVQPIAQVDVDRIVSSMTWQVVVTKPYEFSGKVGLSLETPRGMFAGAYRQELMLDRGNSREMVRIPFSVSKLFEQGIQKQTVSILIGGKKVTSDTAIVRIASCKVSETVSVGYLPDSTGRLEDVLRMTDAQFYPITNRSLLTADLFPYDVLLFGSGCVENYASIRDVSDRFEEYLRQGGSIILFGQPGNFPGNVLPVSFIPAPENLKSSDIEVLMPQARTLSSNYKINYSKFADYFAQPAKASTAIISPGEKVIRTASGGTLLSVTRIGDGQIIYCGLPILEKIAELDLEAIHLFANLLNY